MLYSASCQALNILEWMSGAPASAPPGLLATAIFRSPKRSSPRTPPRPPTWFSSGRLLVGANGLGAEVGHMMAVPDGALCGCGQRGHLEAMASGTAIANAARTRLKSGNAPTSKLWQLSGGDPADVTGAMVGEAAL